MGSAATTADTAADAAPASRPQAPPARTRPAARTKLPTHGALAVAVQDEDEF
jgi:hypothetical protein